MPRPFAYRPYYDPFKPQKDPLKPEPSPIKGIRQRGLTIPRSFFSSLKRVNERKLLASKPDDLDVSNDVWQRSVTAILAQERLASCNRELAEKVKHEFNYWLLGKSTYNKEKPSKDDPTFWGRRKLIGPEIDLYFKNIVEAEHEFLGELTKLRLNIPNKLIDAWIYFVFFVYEWPNDETPDKSYFDWIKAYWPGWGPDKKWKNIKKLSKETSMVREENDYEAQPQDDEAIPRYIGSGIRPEDRGVPVCGVNRNRGGGGGGGDAMDMDHAPPDDLDPEELPDVQDPDTELNNAPSSRPPGPDRELTDAMKEFAAVLKEAMSAPSSSSALPPQTQTQGKASTTEKDCCSFY